MSEILTTMKITTPIIQSWGSIANPRTVNGNTPIAPSVTIARKNPENQNQTQMQIIAFIDVKAQTPTITLGTDNNVYIDFSGPIETPKDVRVYNIAFDYQVNLKGKTVCVYVRNTGNSTKINLGTGDPETSRGTETTVQGNGIGEEENIHI